MSKFMFLIRGGGEAMTAMSPEEKEKHMELWKTWMSSLKDKGKLVDGLPLSDEGKRIVGRDKMVSDGPYAEGKEIVGGYIIVNAKDIDEAVALSKGCPIFKSDGEAEIREILSMD
jgi:hypothetical protein